MRYLPLVSINGRETKPQTQLVARTPIKILFSYLKHPFSRAIASQRAVRKPRSNRHAGRTHSNSGMFLSSHFLYARRGYVQGRSRIVSPNRRQELARAQAAPDHLPKQDGKGFQDHLRIRRRTRDSHVLDRHAQDRILLLHKQQ